MVEPAMHIFFTEAPAKILVSIGWWLQSMDQGLWERPLQHTKDTICLGWLLYLADEYDKEALCQEIWQFTGVLVAIQFSTIDNATPRIYEDKKAQRSENRHKYG